MADARPETVWVLRGHTKILCSRIWILHFCCIPPKTGVIPPPHTPTMNTEELSSVPAEDSSVLMFWRCGWGAAAGTSPYPSTFVLCLALPEQACEGPKTAAQERKGPICFGPVIAVFRTRAQSWKALWLFWERASLFQLSWTCLVSISNRRFCLIA